MIRAILPGRAGQFILTLTLAAGMTVGVGSSAYAATGFPADGQPCTFDQLGEDVYKIDSTQVTPVVTHFSTSYVAPGTTGSKTYTLAVENRVSAVISNNQQDSRTVLELVSRTTGFNVQTERASTSNEVTTVAWTFNAPGYYGLYKGTRLVSGAFSRATCDFDLGQPSWYRESGTYSTFDHVEEGSVSCVDKLALGTVRGAAQVRLGCKAALVQPKTAKAAVVPPRTAGR